MPPSSSVTTAEVAPAAVMRSATIPMLSEGLQVTVGVRSSFDTGSPPMAEPTSSSRRRARSSSGRATVAGIR